MLHVVLKQIIEYLLGVQAVVAEGPLHKAGRLLTLVAQGLLHFIEQFTLQGTASIFNFLVFHGISEER